MKTEIHNKKKHLLIPLGIICLFGVIYAQDSKPKPKVTPQPAVTTKPPASKTTTTKATSVTTNNKYGTVTDIDGNVYKTVKIGNQIWMAENLKTTRYNDATPILFGINDNFEWSKIKNGAYCYYGYFDTENGFLYNWYSVASNKLAPKGWRIPTFNDWTILMNYLGGKEYAGSKMKSVTAWYGNGFSPNGTNESGFSGKPSGVRKADGKFCCIYSVSWWSFNESDLCNALSISLVYEDGYLDIAPLNKNTGISIRCIKD